MEWALVATIVTVIGTVIIALNNFFGLQDREVEYLRDRLEVETLEKEIERRKIEKDRELFQEFLEVLLSSGSIDFIDRIEHGWVFVRLGKA